MQVFLFAEVNNSQVTAERATFAPSIMSSLSEHNLICGTGQDNRQEHRRYQQNERGEMRVESCGEWRLSARVMKEGR